MSTLGGDELRGGGLGLTRYLSGTGPSQSVYFFFKKVGEGAKASHRPDSIGTVI